MSATLAARGAQAADGSPTLQALAERVFDDVAAMTGDVRGVSRPAYSDRETQVLDYLAAVAADLGLRSWRDDGANLVIAMGEDGGAASACGYIGSHVDSVPRGGNFDGLAGVAAAMLVLVSLQRAGTRLASPVRVLALRGEECAYFGTACIGSQALLGALDPHVLESQGRGVAQTLGEAMGETGIDIARIRAGQPLCDAASIRFFIEMHIEQGPVLVERGWPIAAVTGIRGNLRHREIQCLGEAGHSGAVPRWLRRDAVFAICELVTRMNDHWATIQQHGGDLVVTVGMLQTDAAHHAMSRIPGEASFSFEARSQEPATLAAIETLFRSECQSIERERKVRFVFDDRRYTASAQLDTGLIGTMLEACRAEGLPAEAIPSGAGHDAAIFAQAGVPSGMIFVRNRNGSHNPDEAMDLADFMAGVAVMQRTVEQLSR
ncbi:hydantoinase/carbamoylase family amidase [Aurantimonas sp. A2-1-M11]|uniref:hydantoinase/carbamoylase family amidase n=1 Tax=Aurantimonas sp. A2-1-M11 TaxID=3113712 RepID=UPI002F959E95